MSKPLAATIATRVFEPEGSAAAYRLAALARALENSGYAVLVLTTQVPQRIASTRRVRRWPVLRDRSGVVRGYLQYASFDIPLFFRLLFSRRADVVIAEPPPTTGVVVRVVCWLRRTPYVYFSADVSSTAAKGIGINPAVVAVVRALESWALRGARAVLAISPAVKHEIIGLGAAEDRVTVVGTGIDTESFSLSGATESEANPYFVYAGTMSEIQGARVFVEGFAQVLRQHPTARLKMFGSGVELAELMALAERIAPDSVDFPGLIPASALTPWLRGAAATLASVRPHKGYDFAFATKALVGLSCGTPVIYAGVGPLGALVAKHHLGWPVEWSATAVAEAMASALDQTPTPAERARYSAWVKQNYSAEAVAATAVSAIDAAHRRS